METEVIDRLEAVLQTETDVERRAKVWSALTLAKVLSSTWRHYVPVKKDKVVEYVTIDKPAGQLSGERAVLEARLKVLLDEVLQ
jgi:hypothetical protein